MKLNKIDWWEGVNDKNWNTKYLELQNILLEWFQQAGSLNYLLNGGVIAENGKEIATYLNFTEFCRLTR